MQQGEGLGSADLVPIRYERGTALSFGRPDEDPEVSLLATSRRSVFAV